MTEVGHADLSRLLQSKRNECNTIVTSRKRKLRELFAVATQAEGLPEDAFANPDAPAATAAEWQFLQASDILQGKTLNDPNIPPRPKLSLDALKRSLARSIQATASHVPQVPTVGTAKEDAPVAKPEARSSDGLATNGTKTVPSPKISKLPANLPQATPIPPAQAVSCRNPVNAEQPVAQATKPPAKVKPTPAPTVSVKDDAKQTNGSADAVAEAGKLERRPTQVTFPPGTKGSPSTEAGKSATEAGDVNVATGTALEKGSGDTSNQSQAEASHGLSIKLPNNVPKAPDAVSSPGSTAPSATTPVVHDVSTNTSPENDGSQYMDERTDHEAEQKAEQKGEISDGVHGGAVAGSVETEIQKQAPKTATGSDEDQLLQESIRSSAAAASPDASTNVPNAPEVKAAPDGPQETPSVDSIELHRTNGPALPASSTPAVDTNGEAPDSQREAPEEMDVDDPEAAAEAQSSKVLSPREPNIPTQNASTTNSSTTPLPIKTAPLKQLHQAPERAVTRVSSGAMRLKSVTEIVGGSPRPSNATERSTIRAPQNQLTPVTSTPQSPPSRTKSTTRRERAKGQVSAVLFGKQPKRVEDKAIVPGQKETIQASDDYYTPLFIQNFTGATNWMQPIEKILFHANKTIATPDAYLAIQDHQACKVLRRVYHLQQSDKWSLRQPKRCPEPTRPPTQWDVLFQEMKWMRTDFREERKWKMAVAKNLAYACVEWIEATPEERKALQVPAYIPPKAQSTDDVPMGDADADGADNHPTPDLVSGDMDSPQVLDDLGEDFPETVAPSAIFALQDDDVVFALRRTPASDKLLDELPMYGAPLKAPRFELTGPEYDPDAHWRRPALPLSKYVEGQMKLLSEGPPKKRGRYNYRDEESDDEKDSGFDADMLSHNVKLPPASAEVALFTPDSKHIRDRLHAGHQFRPPSEHPMPLQSFYECRSPSQWTMLEDDELRGLVREYSYNWSLISNMLSTKSLFTSGAERRTPWECFERWINLEGLPADMQKTQYFKAYNSRIEAAQRVIAQQNQLAAQQASASGGAVTPVRRRQSTPLRVERRRNQKHLTLIDAMRKLAKKRETTMQKQQHNASQNAAKKTNDTVAQRPTKTPRDYSLLRWERDQALAEKMAQYALRQDAQRRAAIQARVQSQNAQLAGASATAQAGQGATHPGVSNGVNGVGRGGVPNQLAVAAAAAAAQGRPRMPMQAPANGVGGIGVQAQMGGNLAPPAQMSGMPQAQMQALQAMQAQHRMQMPNQQPDASLMIRAQRISEQQRAAVQIQHAQQQTPGQQGQQGSPPNMRNGVAAINQQNFMNNAQAMVASFNANGGHSSPAANGLHMPSIPNGTSPGPRLPTQIPPNIVVQLNSLETQFRAKNPSLTPEQARHLATEHLTRAMMAQRQSAMNAAAGGQLGIASSIAATTSPHQYAALLRQQQQQQQQQQPQPPQSQQPQPQSQSQQPPSQTQPPAQPPAQPQAQPQQQPPQPPPQQQVNPPAGSPAQAAPPRQASGSATPSASK